MQESELAKRYKGDREFLFKGKSMPKDPLEPIETETLRKTESVTIKLQRERKKENITRIMKMKYQK